MRKIKLLILGLLFLPSLALASTGYTLTGFGESGVNGQYCPNGDTSNGNPVYELDSTHFIFYGTDGSPAFYWVISSAVIPGYDGTIWKYYSVPTSATPDLYLYYQEVSGALPYGTVVSSTCGGGGMGSGTPTSTAVIETASVYFISTVFLMMIIVTVYLAIFFMIFYVAGFAMAAFIRPIIKIIYHE